MEKILKLYTYVDGTNDTPFPSSEEQVIIGSFTYTANRMGSSPTITATVKHRLCLDDLWNDKVYAEFNGEKYFVINTPSSSKSNDDTRYEHDLELLSEREVLNHVYFIDAVQGDSGVDQYKSNSTVVLFNGDITQFVARLNASLSYSGLDYKAVIDEGVSSPSEQVSFENKYVLEALQEIFNIYELPYYFVGKTIHIGFTTNTITTPLKYGYSDALLSISKDNANYQVINRITGAGSSDNIPYYYPNPSADRDEIESSGGKWITPSQNLMPPIYRESNGAERFYNAQNNKYPNGEGGYYEFENEYSQNKPLEGIVSFPEIKPTIVGITNSSGQRIDMFAEFAYDTNDNDEVDEEGKYVHPYFFARLKKTDGDYGFNLFEQAIENQTMQISMTSGICGSCTFEIGVGENTSKNTVQVSPSGALLRDEDGDVRCGREGKPAETPQEQQNDTRNNSVWIALKKDDTTYPQVMPNKSLNYRPSANDTFVILGINLPQGYITRAEQQLEDSLIKHMWMNNREKFTFSAKFSRIFFTEHPEILNSLNENSRVVIEYNNQQHTLYIDNYTYKMDSGTPLPEIDIDLVDTLTIGKNSLQTAIDSVKQDILSSIGGGDFLAQGLKYFIRKDVADTARGKITFLRGIDIGTFTQYSGGGTFRILEDSSTYAEVDRLRVRVKAYFETLEIINTNSVGGKMILTAGGGVYLNKIVDRETIVDDETGESEEIVWDYYRCYFLTQQDGREIENRFKVGDLAISQSFNIKAGTSTNVSNHYYWREVVGIGEDYIDLSKSICDTGSDAPQVEDVVCHLGNRTDKDRQGAIIFSAVDVFSPSITLYYGINDFSYTNKDYVSYGVDKTSGNAFFRVYGEMYAGDREQTSYMKYTPNYGVEIKGKFLNTAGENISDIINNIQNQVDGAIETWFYEPEPTLENQPAVNWTTDEEKNNHLGDLYYSGEGKAYRFQKNGNAYEWKLIQDTDITKALEEAKKAQQAAENAKSEAEAASDRLDQWASDGVISPTEKQSIKDEIARIDADKENINNEYTKYTLGTPTAFNTAHSNYRSVLVSLSASTPENIPIPSDFATKQEAYYTARTNALGAISNAAKDLAETANEEAIKAQQVAAAAAEAAQNAQETADGLKNFTDKAFSDGIIDRSEAAAIEKYINSVNETKKSVEGTYNTLVNNPYFDNGDVKTALTTAYNNLINEISDLIAAINNTIADNIVSSQEKATVDTAYGVFSDKVKEYDVAVQNANKQIQEKLKGYSDEALKAAQEAAKAAADAKEDAENVKSTVDKMRDFTDEAFKDGIVDRSEASSIATYINSINTFAKDVQESYNKVYNNPLLEGTDKTNLKKAYDAFNTAKNELVSSINGAIADGIVSSIEKSGVDGKYSAFNTKYGDFIAYINAANKYIQDVINKNALDALDKIGELDYLKAALKEYTSIEGGLIQSSTLALGYTSSAGYVVMAGTNGIYDDSKLGGGIASWWGGAMFDRFEYTTETMPANVAKGLIRMDGTGYFANGNLWWEADGTLHADPLSFFVGPDSVGDVLGLFQFVKSDAGIEYVIPQYPFQKLEIGNYIQIGKAQLYWDETNKAFYVRHQDGVTPVGFYATGFISALGGNPDAGGSVSGATKLSELSDVQLGSLSTNQILSWNGRNWTNVNMPERGASNWDEVEGKPSVFSTNIANITDLHSSWDALLKAAPSSYVTRWPTISEVTGKQNLVIKLNSGSTEGTNQFTYNVTSAKTVNITTSNIGADAKFVTALGTSGNYLTWTKNGTTNNITVPYATNSQKLVPTSYDTGDLNNLTYGSYATRLFYAKGKNSVSNTPNGSEGFGLMVMRTASGYTGQILMSPYGSLYTRYNGNNAWSAWRTVLDSSNYTTYTVTKTGSGASGTWGISITGNSATSTKLQTARTLWGQSFNGTANVSGNMTGVGSFTGVGQFKYGASEESNATYGKYHRLNLGYHGIEHTDFYEQVFNFYSNGGGTTWAKIGSTNYFNGNVGIGTTSPTHKLHVEGTGYFSQQLTVARIKIGEGILSWDSTNGCFKFSKGLYSEEFVSAKGANDDSGSSSGGSYDRLDDWADYTANASTWVLSAKLGYGLYQDVNSLKSGSALKFTTTGSGNVVSAISKNGTTVTVTKGITAALNNGSNASGTWGISITGSSARISSTSISNGSLADKKTAGYLYHAGGNNSVTDKPSGVDAFGMFVMQTAGSWTGQILMSSNTATGLYWRTANNNFNGGWKKVLDSSNYTGTLDGRYVKKTGDTMTGALNVKGNVTAPTFVGSLSGNASTATKLQTARQINGTNFDGSANITTAKWGNARTLTLGQDSTGSVSMDGSRNVTLNARNKYIVGDRSQQIAVSGNYSVAAYSGATGFSSWAFGATRNTSRGYISVLKPSATALNVAAYGTILAVGTGDTHMFIGMNYSSANLRVGAGNADKIVWQKQVAFTDSNVASATNADKLDNVHLNGIFTGFSANGNNTRLVIGGVTKDLTVPYAKNSDTVDSWHGVGTSGNVLKKSGYVTSNTAGLSSYWCKLASLTWGNSTSNDRDVTLYLHSAYNEKVGIIHIRLRWLSSTSTRQKCYILSGNLSTASIRLYYDRSSSSATNELWYNTAGQWNVINAVVISETGRVQEESSQITLYRNSFSSVQSLPSKSYVEASYYTLGNSISGNAASATKLQTSRTIWGKSFNGTGNVSGNMTGVGSISASGNITTDNALFQIDATNISGNRGLNVLYNGQSVFCGFGTSGTKGLFITHSGSSPGWVLSVPSSTVVAIAQNSGINVGIGTTSPSYKLHVAGTGYFTGELKGNTTIYARTGMYSDGYVSAKGNNSSSDIRLKNILCEIRMSIKDFARAPLFKFAWKSNPEMVEIGSSAQYWKNILPNAVKERDGWLEMGYGNIALAGVITIAREVESIEQRVKRLEHENKKLKEQIKKMERRTA